MYEDDTNLRAAFSDSVEQCKKLSYVPGYFLKMLAQRGAVGAAKELLDAPHESEGFTKLYLLAKERGPHVLDLTVEAIALRPEHRHHFSETQLATATRRLGMLR